MPVYHVILKKDEEGISNFDWIWSDYQTYLENAEDPEFFFDWVQKAYPECVEEVVEAKEYRARIEAREKEERQT